jgi:hypothetical protein
MTLAIALISSLVAASVALWGFQFQRASARRRNTFEHIVRMEADQAFIDARRKFIELSKTATGLVIWATEEKESSYEAQSIRLVLNQFEIVSIGIELGILDFETFKRWFHSTVIRFWAHAESYIKSLRARTNNPALFHEFESLAQWMKDGKVPPARRRLFRIR